MLFQQFLEADILLILVRHPENILRVTFHSHPSHFIGPIISLALACWALKAWSDWFNSELIHWPLGPSTVLSYNIASFLAMLARM